MGGKFMKILTGHETQSARGSLFFITVILTSDGIF
jgi:hypothetical protein